MMLTILRSISLVLCLLYIGYAISAAKGVQDVGLRLIAIGRIGVVLAIIILLSADLAGKDELAEYMFNLILIPSVIMSGIGMTRIYRREDVR